MVVTPRIVASVATLALFALVVRAGPSEPDRLLMERRANVPKQVPWPIDFFQPQAAVKGARATPLAVVPAAARSVDAAALDAAQQYAASVDSSSLLVYHRGALQLAWYATPEGAGRLEHTYNMQWVPLVLLVGIAIDEGRIASVDEPAVTYLPEWRGTERERITIRHLLQQGAGLELRRDAHYSRGLFSRDARAYWGSHTKSVILNEYPAIAEPGSRFDYNYIVPEILGVILERATGIRYEDYLSTRLWGPLGNRTAYLWLNRPGGEPHLNAALFSTASDWLNVGRLLLQRGEYNGKRLVAASWIDEIVRPSTANPNFGFTWLGAPHQAKRRLTMDPRVNYTVEAAEPFAADDVLYIDGYGGQRVYISPSRDLVVVRLGGVARAGWDNSKLFNLVAAGLR